MVLYFVRAIFRKSPPEIKLLKRQSLVERGRCVVGRRGVRENGVSNFEIKIREREDVCVN
ncbi:hypothetical protein HYC85_009954 [Camellia sinensis]|uniref:Uncharacterized protein n=1 Tax=Camellia sinensis TaxID=4442 RepID=A0A7J7HGH8_CAMSI|nr:hypothetical protein HYC85_009954 [Camellia sinensis]